MTSSKVSLKLLVDTKSNKVLFAEAGKDFVDFLFNILALPFGTVIGLLKKEIMAGCLGNLYQSIEKLSETYMQPNLDKNILLEPKTQTYVSNISPVLLLSNTVSSTPRNLYMCSCYNYVASDRNVNCPQCHRSIFSPVTFSSTPRNVKFIESQPDKKASSSGEDGGYVKGVVTYMVMDDLVVKPMSTISSITLLNKFNVKDLGTLQERVVHFAMNEAIILLKASMQSKTVLTDVFLLRS